MNGAPDPQDAAHMRAALALAWRGVGNSWPNPSVGCVVVKDGRVLGRAVTCAGRAAACRAGGARAGRRGGAGRHGVCDAGAVLPLGPHAALHRCADRRRSGAGGGCPAGSGQAGGWRRDRPAAGGGDRGYRAGAGARGGRGVGRVRAASARGPAISHAEACQHAGRADRDRRRGEPLDHRPGGAAGGARAAWPA